MPEPEGGNFFTRKLGPLPVWAWAALAIALIGGYMYLKKIGPFAASAPSGTGYPSVDPSSLASMLGAGGSTDLGVLGGSPGAPDQPLPSPIDTRGGTSQAGLLGHNFGRIHLDQSTTPPVMPGALAGTR